MFDTIPLHCAALFLKTNCSQNSSNSFEIQWLVKPCTLNGHAFQAARLALLGQTLHESLRPCDTANTR